MALPAPSCPRVLGSGTPLLLASRWRPHARCPPSRPSKCSALTAQASLRCAAAAANDDQVPAGCSRYSLELSRPLGIVFEERKEGGIFVAEVPEGGRAAQTGQVSVGDELIACSGVTFNSSESYGGVRVAKGMQVVRMPVRGESFDGVLAAIGSHPAYMKVKLEFQKCQSPPS